MILLDTHVVVWWSVGDDRLSAKHREVIVGRENAGLAVSAFTFWEVAPLATRGRVELGGRSIDVWIELVSALPTIHVLPATPQILVDSTRLPDGFHPDPADRIIVATARAHGLPLLTEDRKILAYPHVESVGPT